MDEGCGLFVLDNHDIISVKVYDVDAEDRPTKEVVMRMMLYF